MKKEIVVAAGSAVALIFCLGSVSYFLFPKVSVEGYTATIDVFTRLGGRGNDQPGGNFSISQNGTVRLFVEVRNASNNPQGNYTIAFEIHWPVNSGQNGAVYDIGTEKTNVSGIAEIRAPLGIPIVLLQNQGRDPRGDWLVYVTTSVDDQPLADTLTFSVQ